jgi:uncharacterized protein (DUF58 family)
MLTRQGWLVGVGAIALLVAGRVLGIFELFLLGAGAAALLLLCTLATSLTRLRLDVGRELHPPRVHAGSPSRVEVGVRNAGGRRTPVLRLRDPVAGTRGAELLLGPLKGGERARAAYRLPTDKRGVIDVGPLDVIASDPFGLTSVAMPAAPRVQLTVFPRVDEVVPVPHTQGHDPHAGADHPNALGVIGEDFYALRPYVLGDDLRRVHWPSTARHDSLMVRQDELPWQGRVTIMLDLRHRTHTPETLEAAVSAAASVVTACWRRRDLVRVVTTDGRDSGYAAGHAHIEALMEHLAVVGPSADAPLHRVLNALRRSASGGALVVMVGQVAPNERDMIARLRGTFGALTLVTFGSVRGEARGQEIRVSPDVPFAGAWNRAMKRRTSGAMV